MEKLHGKSVNMTSGNIPKQIIGFVLPLFFSSIISQVYNICDTKIVGKILGSIAFAAVGSTSTAISIYSSFAFQMIIGFSIVIANCFGANDKQRLKMAIDANYLLSAIICVFFFTMQFLTLDIFLTWLETPEEIYAMAKEYLSIIIIGFPILLFYNSFCSILRSEGNSTVPFVVGIVSTIVNIILDYILVSSLQSVKGAAIATVISQFVATVIIYVYILLRFPECALPKGKIKLNKNDVKSMLKLGLSMGFCALFITFGGFCIQKPINHLGVNTITAHVAARKFDEMFMYLLFNIESTMVVFAGQNYGCGKIGRMKQGLKWSIAIVTAYLALSTTVCFLFADKFIVWLSNNESKEVVDIAVKYLRFNVPCQLILGTGFCFRAQLQGMRVTLMPSVMGGLEGSVKILIAFVFSKYFAYNAIIVCEPIAWTLMLFVAMITYFLHVKKIQKTSEAFLQEGALSK